MAVVGIFLLLLLHISLPTILTVWFFIWAYHAGRKRQAVQEQLQQVPIPRLARASRQTPAPERPLNYIPRWTATQKTMEQKDKLYFDRMLNS